MFPTLQKYKAAIGEMVKPHCNTVIRRIPRYGRQRGSLLQYSTLHGKHYNNKKTNNNNSTMEYDKVPEKVPEEATSR